MTNFDVKIEKMQEENARKQNEKWNALLLKSLCTRTKQDVLRAMLDLLVIPVGSANVLAEPNKETVLA